MGTWEGNDVYKVFLKRTHNATITQVDVAGDLHKFYFPINAPVCQGCAISGLSAFIASPSIKEQKLSQIFI